MKPLNVRTAVCLSALALAIAIGGTSCRGQNAADTSQESASEREEEVDNSLTFNNITLEQADDSGKPQWKVKATQATYSQDKKSAEVTNPEGELYDEGKPVYRIKALSGKLEEDGEKITLNGNVIATDIKSGAVLRGDELIWEPNDGTLTVRKNVVGTHPRLNITANEARLNNRRRRLEASGQVVAVSKDPNLKLQGPRIIWRIDDQIVLSNDPIRVERLNNGKVQDIAVGQQAEVNLETKVATLRQNAGLELRDPAARITSNLLLWDLNKSEVSTNQPITIIHREEQITVTADAGRMDLRRRIVYLNKNVKAIAQRNRSTLIADRLTWDIPSERLDAVGNVNYNQPDPPMQVKGPRAVGRLENQVIVVSGGRVVTEIVPEALNN